MVLPNGRTTANRPAVRPLDGSLHFEISQHRGNSDKALCFDREADTD